VTKGKLSDSADQRQEKIENPLALIGATLARLDHDSLRIRQAIKRAGLADLLSPVLDDHRQIAGDLRKVQAYLRDIWEEGQDSRWK